MQVWGAPFFSGFPVGFSAMLVALNSGLFPPCSPSSSDYVPSSFCMFLIGLRYLQILFIFYFLKLINLFILAVLGLRCRTWAFSSCVERGLLCCGARAFHCGGFSCCGARALGTRALEHRLSSCGARA